MLKKLLIWGGIGLALALLFNVTDSTPYQAQQIAFSDFVDRVRARQVREVTIRGDAIQGIFEDQRRFQTYAPEQAKIVDLLIEQGVRIQAQDPAQGGFFVALLGSWLPILLIIGVWLLFMRNFQGGAKALQFGKMRNREASEKQPQITFQDVAGIDEAKEELSEIVEYLLEPKRFDKLGGKIPTGVLLIGPPGTGKTMLARAVAGEAGVPFFSISGSDFVEMFVGVGASRVRDLFEQGKKSAPCIIFIDEIDAVGRHRGSGLGGGHDEREQTLNQLLVEMDGFKDNEGVIMVAATNRPDVLDPALLRPGRFDRHVAVSLPDVQGREKILTVHSAKVRLAKDVSLELIARGTPGFSGADLANLINEAALWAARQNKKEVCQEDLEYAKDKVLMGNERRSMLIPDHEKRVTAYHEAGHALVAALIPEVDPVHKVTIIPRGRALGLTQLIPETDRFGYKRSQLMGRIAMMLGGRVAEELTFQEYTTGASNDIKEVTSLARRMVTQWGMGETLGPVFYAEGQGDVYLGRDLMQHHARSERTSSLIDREVRQIIASCHQKAKTLLLDHKRLLEQLAEKLIEYETVDGDDLRRMVSGDAHSGEEASGGITAGGISPGNLAAT